MSNTLAFQKNITSQRGMILMSFAAIYIIWGSTYLAVRFAVVSISPFLLSSFRFLFAGSILLLIAKLTKASLPNKHEIKNASIIGLLLLVTGNGGVIWASQFVPSSITALVITIEPIWVVLILWIKSKENKPSAIIWIGMFLGIIGIITLVGPSNYAQIAGFHPIGIIAIVLSSLSWAIGSVYSMQLTLPKNAFTSTGIQMFTASISMFIIASLLGEWEHFNPNEIKFTSITAFMYLVLFGSLVGFTSYAYLVKNVSATSVATHAYVNPIIAVFLGWWIGKEIISSQIIVAGILLISAVILIIVKPNLIFWRR